MLLACWMLTGCAGGMSQAPGTPPVPALFVQESDAGKSIDVQPGRKVTFRLEANHATGYRWSVSTAGDRLEQLGEPYYSPEKSEYWTFMPKKAGTQEFRFEYRRPWEQDKPAAKSVSYTVNVR